MNSNNALAFYETNEIREVNVNCKTKDNIKDRYFFETLEKCKYDPKNLNKYIVNPMMGYYLCNQFIGSDYTIIPDSYDILRNGFKGINHLDVIYVQVNQFQFFCNNILPQIDNKFILITGQYHFPQLNVSSLTEKVLNNEYLQFWFSQNPIYKHHKYMAIPYGIHETYLAPYVEALLNKSKILKDQKLISLGMSKNSHPCRKILPDFPYYPVKQFYEIMSKAQFILSPIGDRPDCYRHWEAIGLGTVPISNVPDLYRDLFQNNMIYVSDTQEMLNLLSDSKELNYMAPNRDIICIEYWRDIIKLCVN